MAAVTFGLWEWIGIRIENQERAKAKRLDDLEIENLRLGAEIDASLSLQSTLEVIVRRKIEEIRKRCEIDLQLGQTQDVVRLIRNALQPKAHAERILEQLSVLLEDIHDGEGQPAFRIGLYVEDQDGFLSPWVSFDSGRQSNEFGRSAPQRVRGRGDLAFLIRLAHFPN